MTSVDASGLLVKIVNPFASVSSWESNLRIQEIALVYRKTGSKAWIPALTASSSAIKFDFTVSCSCYLTDYLLTCTFSIRVE